MLLGIIYDYKKIYVAKYYLNITKCQLKFNCNHKFLWQAKTKSNYRFE